MNTITILLLIIVALFALAGFLSNIAIIILLRTVRNGGQLIFGYSEEDDSEGEN